MATSLLKTPLMLVFLTLTVSLTIMLQGVLPALLAEFSTPIQSYCISLSPQSTHAEVYRALVCGDRLTSPILRESLRQTSLLHLIVASGTHLIVIEALLRRALGKRRWSAASVGICLGLYALMTGLGPPFVRVLLAWLLKALNDRFRLCWSRTQILMMSGTFSLLVCSTRWDLLSLSLSWIAGFAVELAGDRHQKDPLKFHALVYAFMIPALLPLTVPHPVSIVWNLLLGPVLTLALFPLAGLAIFVPTVMLFPIDFVFSLAFALIDSAAGLTPQGLNKSSLNPGWPWIYLAGLMLTSFWFESRTLKRELEETT